MKGIRYIGPFRLIYSEQQLETCVPSFIRIALELRLERQIDGRKSRHGYIDSHGDAELGSQAPAHKKYMLLNARIYKCVCIY